MSVLEIVNAIPELPADPSLEGSLLGSLLVNNEAMLLLPADFDVDCFFEPLHQRIYTAIKDGISAGNRVDPLSLKRQFDIDPDLIDIGGGAYLGKLAVSCAYGNAVSDYAKELADMAAKRRIIDACQRAYSRVNEAGITAGEIGAELLAEIEREASGRYRISTEYDVTERIFERLRDKKSTPCNRTGITRLDKAMDGGMFAGKLYGIVGRKKMGKTMLASTISTNLMKGDGRHLFIALEMGSEEIQQRNLAREIGCYESAFRNEYGQSNEFLQKLAEYTQRVKNNRIYLDAPGITFNDLRHTLPAMIRRHKIDGFILDCWQLVGGKGKGQSTAEHQDAVAQWLAEIVKKYRIWGLATAQENQDENTRGGEGLRLACDQLYRIKKRDETCSEAWLEMMETRYTPWMNIGEEHSPSLRMSDKGTHYDEI